MNNWQCVEQLVEQVLDGQPPTHEQGVKIIRARDAEYTAYMAGAHHLKQKQFNDVAQLCSIINAKSGRCQENCSFCA